MHSGLLVFLWLAVVAGLQFLDVFPLSLALAGCVALGAVLAPARSVRLVRRVRFIVLAIVILFAGFTPGEAVFVDWPRLSPSREGVLLAWEHAARVLVVVLLVAVLLERLPPGRLIGAIHALMRPFSAIGFPADRVAVRTLLVLRLVEAEKPPRWDQWISDDSSDLHEAIEVRRERFSAPDYAVLGVLALGVMLWLAWGLR